MLAEQNQILSREELFIRLYRKAFPSTASFVKKYGGSLEDAKDVFQDSLVIYFEKHVNGDFSPKTTEEAYLTGIARHLWHTNYHKRKRELELATELEINAIGQQEPVISKRLLNFIEHSGKKCMELLNAFYYEKSSMKDIAHKFGFSGERSATAQKFKCLEKIRDSVKQYSLTKTDFYE